MGIIVQFKVTLSSERGEWRSWNDVCIAAADRDCWRRDVEA